MHLKVKMKVITIIFVTILFLRSSVPAAAQESCSNFGRVRLIGGSNEREGRVEVCIGGVWRTVCDDSWSYSDARVVCRQLGFEVDTPGGYTYAYSYARYGQGTGPILVDIFHCTGEESSLLDCQYTHNSRFCSHSEDAGVRCPSTNCTHGNVRLIGGLDPTEGRVEVCVQGRWSGVCHLSWNYQDAFVVCRQLGYPATGSVAYTSSSSRFGRGVVANLTNFRCYGSESNLPNCTHSVTSSCSRQYTAGVLCYGDVVPVSPQCFSNGNIRLVGGASSNEGRVEVCVSGMWGTVTNNGWDSREATVVCKQLGYQNPIAYPIYTSSSTFGAGSGPIFLSHLNCIGNEQTLLACSSSYPHPYYYSHYSDAGVRCEHRQYSGCTNVTLRLVGGQSSNEGRVEICINGVWGSVCDDSWGSSDARVVCRQLGLPYDAGVVPYRNAYFGRGSGPYHLANVYCSGTESSLLSCRRRYSEIGVHICRPGNEAGVKCVSIAALSFCTHHGDVRLVGGETSYEGMVEICFNGSWVLVCGRYYYWNVYASTVVCRQLTGELNPTTTAIRYTRGIYRRGSSGSSYIISSCSGSENQLLNCSFSTLSYCSWGNEAGVRCYVNSSCVDGDVHLTGGDSEMEGRVEVCHNQIWWAVSSSPSYWDYRDATVVCRHLNYPANWAIPMSTALFGRGNATILVQDFGCTGTEETLWECASRNYSISSYYSRGYYVSNRGQVASVICQGNTTSQPECSSGDLRLVSGERDSEGRVEICVEGFWGTVCDKYNWWRKEEAAIVCRQLDMKSSGAISVGDAYFGEGSGPVLEYIDCAGTEPNVTECSRGRVGQLNCHHGKDVGVICQDPVYSVTVVTDPPSGPHLIESTVNLTCLIHPQPPGEGVMYQWRDYVPNISPVVANSSLPYATLTIQIGHPHTARYHCRVYYRNQLLASGSTVITVQGLLSPIGPTVVQYNTSDTVILRVNITPTATFTRDYLRALTWYHNGVKINPRFYRYRTTSLSSDNTTLTIISARGWHGGVYHVQFAGLRIYPYNKLCEEETLAILRHYPLLSPVLFNVYTNENPYENPSEDECPVNRGYIRATPNSQVLPYTTSDSITLSINGNAPTTQLSSLSTSWYFNGYGSLPSGTSVSSLLKLPTGITQTLRINNPTHLHAGTYEVLLLLNTGSYSYFQQFACPYNYWYFVHYSNRAGVNPLILDQISFNLQYYEPATIYIQSSRPALQDSENTIFNCTAHDGYPPSSSISWVKNGRVVSTTSEDQLVITVAANDTHAFGQYNCVVNNSVTKMETSFLMKQKDELQVVLDLGSSRQCDSLNNDSQQTLKTSIANTIQEMCSCNFTSSDLEEFEMTCSTNDNTTMTFTTTVVYSTESGDMTASTLIRMFQDRAASTSTVISVGSQTATIVSVCSPSCTAEPQPSPTSTPKLQVEEERPTSDVATLVGAYLGGLVTGMIILIIAAVTVCVLVKRRSIKLKGRTRPVTQTSTKTTAAAKDVDMVHYTSESVQISPNAAYKSVTFPQEAIYDQPL